MKVAAAIRRAMRARCLPPVLGGLGVALCVSILYISQPSMLQSLDLKVYDAFLPLKVRGSISDIPLIIDIDEASLAAHGQWPWPRYLTADLLDRLTSLGAAAIGLDILFSEADRASPSAMRAALAGDRGVRLEFSGLPDALDDFDALFAASLRSAPAVLGAYARFTVAPESVFTGDKPRPPAFLAFGSQGAAPLASRLPKAPDAALPLPLFSREAPIGFINIAPDADGVVRRIPLALRFGDDLYPALSMGSLMRALGSGTLRAYAGPDGMLGMKAGEFFAPVSPEGQMLIPFQGGRKTYPYISASDLLNGRVGPEHVRGRIALVGTSAPGLADMRATPFDRFVPGVEIRAYCIKLLKLLTL